MKSFKLMAVSAMAAGVALAGSASAGEFSANVNATTNYLWRGLTQSENDPAIQGGLDYVDDSGFYLGTWISNVSYADGDAFSYEHDMYVGYSGEYNGFSYDFGYLYYNYDGAANFDFGEIYGSLGYGGFSVTAYVLANTEADDFVVYDNPGQTDMFDFGFASTYYISADYAFEIRPELELGFHLGFHSGDFNEGFNVTTNDYLDYSVSLSKGGFTATVSDTNAKSSFNGLYDPGYAPSGSSASGLDNGSPKFVISYSVDFEL